MSMPVRQSKPPIQTGRDRRAVGLPGAPSHPPAPLLRRQRARHAATQLYRGVLTCTYDASGQNGASR